MPITCQPLLIPTERNELVAWLSSETWPFHVKAVLSRQHVEELIDAGEFSKEDQKTFWVLEGSERVGLVRLLDLDDVEDGNPVFDLRLAENRRNAGLGREVVRWLTSYLFATYPELNRIGGSTRVDNYAMRRVLIVCGYIKEGHFRQSWPAEDGTLRDSVYYTILKKDWNSGTTTPVPWEDEDAPQR